LRQINQDLLTSRTDASFAGRAEINQRRTNNEEESTNEELTTSKEEMQSLNEELQTVNAELQNKLSDFEQANNDMKNANINNRLQHFFLDINIRRFTDAVTKLFKLI
jgi:two-component system CheB/CheR fusion protein